MGRKLTAIRTHKRNKPKGIHKPVVVRSHKRRAPKVFRRDFSKSAKEESFGIRQLIGKRIWKIFF